MVSAMFQVGTHPNSSCATNLAEPTFSLDTVPLGWTLGTNEAFPACSLCYLGLRLAVVNSVAEKHLLKNALRTAWDDSLQFFVDNQEQLSSSFLVGTCYGQKFMERITSEIRTIVMVKNCFSSCIRTTNT